MLVQRSGDMGLGSPFNFTQYAVFMHLIAQSVGLRPGLFTHVINNAHIYANHEAVLREQLTLLPYADAMELTEIEKPTKATLTFPNFPKKNGRKQEGKRAKDTRL